jgi:hypothetical protein
VSLRWLEKFPGSGRRLYIWMSSSEARETCLFASLNISNGDEVLLERPSSTFLSIAILPHTWRQRDTKSMPVRRSLWPHAVFKLPFIKIAVSGSARF